MRVLDATVAVAVLVGLTGAASAQSLGDLAVQEKQKRQGKPLPKIITVGDIASMPKRGTVSMTGETPAEASAEAADATGAAEPTGEGTAEPGSAEADSAQAGSPPAGSAGNPPAKKEKTEDEISAERRAVWQKAYDLAKEKVRVHQLNVNNIQKDLNDVTGGIYTERRNTVLKMLADEQAALTSSQAEVDRLDAEGRSNGWPRG
jgi:hypothetical protein